MAGLSICCIGIPNRTLRISGIPTKKQYVFVRIGGYVLVRMGQLSQKTPLFWRAYSKNAKTRPWYDHPCCHFWEQSEQSWKKDACRGKKRLMVKREACHAHECDISIWVWDNTDFPMVYLLMFAVSPRIVLTRFITITTSSQIDYCAYPLQIHRAVPGDRP